MSKDSEIGIISDSCIFRDELGDESDRFLITKSNIASNALLEGLKSSLNKDGLKVNFTESKTVCAFYKNPSLNVNLEFLDGDSSNVKKGDLPYFLESIDDEYKTAIQNVLNRVYTAGKNKDEFQKIFLDSPDIQSSLEVLKKQTKQNRLLIVSSFGKDVSTGKSMAQGIATAVLTLGFISTYNVDFIHLYALVVDLDKKEAIWASDLSMKKPDMYEKEWYANRYYNLTIKGIVENL